MSFHVRFATSLMAMSAISLASAQAEAQQSTPLPPVSVETAKPDDGLTYPICSTAIGKDAIGKKALSTSDTMRLLDGVPGLDTQPAGGISGLPNIHGMSSDRVKTEVDGMSLTSACPNHMNPPLSYMAPSKVESVRVWTGIVPVSEGGDSIAGTIKAKSPDPVFAKPGESLHTEGAVSTFFRSNTDGLGGSATVTAATQDFSLSYSGAKEQASDYRRGGKEHNNTVQFSQHESENHALKFAARHENHLVSIEGGEQFIPRQGYPNMYMDMTENQQWFLNGLYKGEFGWGNLETRAYWQTVRHEMDFLSRNKSPTMPTMPMITDGVNLGYSVKADIPLNEKDTLRVGNEFHRAMIDDYWTPVAGSMMMSPWVNWNIRNGVRDRFGTFAEWESKWTPEWTTLLGLRNDTVMSDAGQVHGYNATMGGYSQDSNAFNALDHAKTDINFDVTALTRFEPNKISTYELGYAMKTRSPNLYERYIWSRTGMNAEMNGWFGDLNGYIGDPDLTPERAHTLSFSANWHDDSAARNWSFGVTPYVTYIQDYIGVIDVGVLSATNDTRKLRFANLAAWMSGVDAQGHYALSDTPDYGRFVLKGTLGWVRGQLAGSHQPDGLYQLMPLNSKLALEHAMGGWNSAIETRLVGSKTHVDTLRREPKTPAYALLNLRTAYTWENITLGAGIDNLFNKLYYNPLGGRDYGDMAYYGGTGSNRPLGPVPGEGRSYNAGLTIKF
ncbi:MAG: TonB-dependent receptor [Rhodospirillales bacterium]|nr:MAG: TonB-dependent receptor [Rhodospirillales bacterium]